MTTLVIIATLLLLGATIRALLVVLGLYKDPVLHTFEAYGEERFYNPLFSFIVWGSVFTAFVMGVYFGLNVIGLPIMLLALPAAYLYPFARRFVQARPQWFARYPRWYQRLKHITEREERRHLAYMWLRLPPGTRLIYNTRDEYFLQWCDLVLLTSSR